MLTEIDPTARYALANRNIIAYTRKHVMVISAEKHILLFDHLLEAKFTHLSVIETYLSSPSASFLDSVSSAILAWPKPCTNQKTPHPLFSRRSCSSTRLSSEPKGTEEEGKQGK